MPVTDEVRIRTELSKILASPLFTNAPRMSRFLSFAVEEALQGRGGQIKEYVIATQVFGKPSGYDPNADSTVRTEATKLRGRLNRYYETDGRDDTLFIEIPKGTYSPQFCERTVELVPEPSPPAQETARPLTGLGILGWGLAALFGALALFLYVIGKPLRDDRQVLKFHLYPPPGVRVASLRGNGPAVVSPDGRHLAFVGFSEGRTQIWIRPLEALSARPLSGTDDASYLFWSPDSQQLAFFADRKLKKVKLTGSAVQTLCDAPLGRGGAWSPGGIIVFATAGSALNAVPADGGIPAAVTTLGANPNDRRHLHPGFLPDGQRFLFLGVSAASTTNVFVSELSRSGYRRPMRVAADTESQVVFAQSKGHDAPGFLLYIRSSSLVAVPFDPAELAIVGEPVTIAEGVRSGFERWVGDFSVSTTRTLVYRSTPSVPSELGWFDRSGKRWDAPAGLSDRDVSLSGDNRSVASIRIRSELDGADIWVRDLERSAETRLTLDRATAYTPVWSGDGRSLYFSSDQPEGYVILRASVLERRPPERLYLAKRFITVNDCSRDDATVVYQVRNGNDEYDLWSVETSGERRAAPILKTPFNEVQAQFSPDGRWLAYASDESGRYEVYIRSWKGATTTQVSVSGGVQPRWRADGRELFYVAPDGRLMAVVIGLSNPPKIGVPTPLFLMRIDPQSADATEVFNYAVSADGRRFLTQGSEIADSTAPWTVVVNWPAAILDSVQRPPGPRR